MGPTYRRKRAYVCVVSHYHSNALNNWPKTEWRLKRIRRVKKFISVLTRVSSFSCRHKSQTLAKAMLHSLVWTRASCAPLHETHFRKLSNLPLAWLGPHEWLGSGTRPIGIRVSVFACTLALIGLRHRHTFTQTYAIGCDYSWLLLLFLLLLRVKYGPVFSHGNIRNERSRKCDARAGTFIASFNMHKINCLCSFMTSCSSSAWITG